MFNSEQKSRVRVAQIQQSVLMEDKMRRAISLIELLMTLAIRTRALALHFLNPIALHKVAGSANFSSTGATEARRRDERLSDQSTSSDKSRVWNNGIPV
jgi:hypothetical protein